MGGNAPGGLADTVGADTVPALLDELIAADPTRPLLTQYDDATGERTELSGATLANWVAKSANLLVDGCATGPGDQVAIWLPPHWQSAAILLGCWRAGTVVAYGEPRAEAATVEFASTEAIVGGAPSSAADRFVLGLAPMGLPLRDVPAGWVDYVAEVRGHGDRYAGPPVTADAAAMLDLSGSPLGSGAPFSHAELVARAREHAHRLGIESGARVLLDADAYPYPLDWLVAPLAMGATLVLCTHTDPAKLASRAESERATIVGPPR